MKTKLSWQVWVSIAFALLMSVFPMLSIMGSMIEGYFKSDNTFHERANDFTRSFEISPQQDKIVFAGPGSGKSDLYVLVLKSHKVTRLTNTPAFESGASFSPDGKSVVYCAGTKERGDHLFIASADGKHSRQITAVDYNDRDPSFSPDGTNVVFVRDQQYRTGGMVQWGTWARSEIFSVRADGSQPMALTGVVGEIANTPRYSSDSRRILITYGEFSPWENTIGEVTLPSANSAVTVRPLTSGSANFSPSYLPGNRSIGFFNDHVDGAKPSNHGFFTMSANGQGLRQIFKSGDFKDPMLTSDGKKIYFISRKTKSLMRIDSDGRNLVTVVKGSFLTNPVQHIIAFPFSGPRKLPAAQ